MLMASAIHDSQVPSSESCSDRCDAGDNEDAALAAGADHRAVEMCLMPQERTCPDSPPGMESTFPIQQRMT